MDQAQSPPPSGRRPSPWAHRPVGVSGRGVLIAGGTTGIGRAAALLLAAEGARVLIVGRHREAIDEALADIQKVGWGEGVAADLAEAQGVRHAFAAVDERLDGLDVLINCVAVRGPSVGHCDNATLDYVMRANLLSFMACAREAIARMVPRGGGHIVNLGSMSSAVREPDAGTYVAAKGAILAWSESLRKTYNREGIRVTLIEPGNVDTDLHATTTEYQRGLVDKGEMLAAEDVAELIHFCLTRPPRCDVITAQVRPHGQYI